MKELVKVIKDISIYGLKVLTSSRNLTSSFGINPSRWQALLDTIIGMLPNVFASFVGGPAISTPLRLWMIR